MAPPALWGFLVGFVGWGSCFRLAEPIGEWLVPSPPRAEATRGIVRLIVTIFLIMATLMALALLPMLLAAAGRLAPGQAPWRTVFGITLAGSFAGLTTLGILRRRHGV